MILSIIIPTYNSEKTIIRAIDSCCIESINGIEVVVIDDGSQDKTIDIIKRKYSQYISSQKIKLISADHEGAGNARNIGINNAIGKWIIFLDSDDKFKDIKAVIEDLKSFEDKTFDILNYSVNYMQSFNSSENMFHGKDLIKDNLGLVNEKIKLWDSRPAYKIFNRNFLEENNIEFPIDIKIGEDLVFNQKCLQTDANVLVKSGDIYEVIDNEDSITHTIVKQDILDDGVRLTNLVQNFNIPFEFKQMFIAKNFISILVRFLKSYYSINDVITSLKQYKCSFNIEKTGQIFLRLRDNLNIPIVLVSWMIWGNPNILKVLFPIMKKIKY